MVSRPGRQHTELFLSSDHTVCVEQALIPIKRAINRGNIARLQIARVTCHHIELAERNVLPVESFADIRDGSCGANCLKMA